MVDLTKIVTWEVRCSQISDASTRMAPPMAAEVYAYVGVLEIELVHKGFKSASLKAGRIKKQLETEHMLITYSEMASMLRELRERIEDDFHSVVFVNLSVEESELYEHPGGVID